MGKFIGGVLTTLVIFFTIYAFNTKDIGNIGLAFFYCDLMFLVYGVNFGMFLEKNENSRR